jgi:hypothetical protein
MAFHKSLSAAAWLAVLAASAGPAADPGGLKPEWRENRNSLLWWRPHSSFTEGAGAAPVAPLEKRLLAELDAPGGGAPDRVADVLERLATACETYDVTNVLARALFREKNAFRFRTLLACVDAWPPDMSDLSGRIMSATPPGTRAEWYAGIGKEISGLAAGGRAPAFRKLTRVRVFAEALSRSEPDADCARALDGVLSELPRVQELPYPRQHLAWRFREAAGESGAHFRELARGAGPPAPPSDRDLDDFVTGVPRWPDHSAAAGDPPRAYVPEAFSAAYLLGPPWFGVTRQDLVRRIAERFAAYPWDPEKDRRRWWCYVCALEHGAGPAAAAALAGAVEAGGLPSGGAGRLDGALLSCDPAWEKSAARQRFLERAAQLCPPKKPCRNTPGEIAELNRQLEQ